MPTNGQSDGLFYGINGIPLFTYGMIGITTLVLAYITMLDIEEPLKLAENSAENFEKITGTPVSELNPLNMTESNKESEGESEVEQAKEEGEGEGEAEQAKEEAEGEGEQAKEEEEAPPTTAPAPAPKTGGKTTKKSKKQLRKKTRSNKRNSKKQSNK